MTAERPVGRTRTILFQLEDTAPPELPVLEVEIIGTEAFLTVSEYEEDGEQSTYREKATIRVLVRDLMRALDGDVFVAGAEWRLDNCQRRLGEGTQ